MTTTYSPNAPEARPLAENYVPKRKIGRCASGAGADGGYIYHAVLSTLHPWGKALCGTSPGSRGNGWSDYPGERVTCIVCLKKAALLKALAEDTGRKT